MNEKEEFQIIYDGPALSTHEMDVRDLAPALIAVSDLLEETNRVMYGDAAQVQVNVKGSFKTGCFQVDFSLAQKLADQVNAFFSSPSGITTAGILSILGVNVLNGFGLLPFVSWLKNRKIKKITKLSDGKSSVEVDDESREVEDKTLELYRNLKVRKSLEVIIRKPLEKEGVDSFAIMYKEEYTKVSKEESQYYKIPEMEDEPLEEQTVETNLQAIGVSFLEDNKWRFSDGAVAFYAEVQDKDFIQRVQENREAFAKDDILKVRMLKKQYVGDNGIKSEYVILKIISHRSSAKQIPLPLSEK